MDENQNMQTEKELKYIPRIEQLLRENAALKNAKERDDEPDVDGLLVQNEYLQEQLNQVRAKAAGTYKSREERADLLFQNEQLRDEKETLL